MLTYCERDGAESETFSRCVLEQLHWYFIQCSALPIKEMGENGAILVSTNTENLKRFREFRVFDDSHFIGG